MRKSMASDSIGGDAYLIIKGEKVGELKEIRFDFDARMPKYCARHIPKDTYSLLMLRELKHFPGRGHICPDCGKQTKRPSIWKLKEDNNGN